MNKISPVLTQLAPLFEAENRPGGDAAAAALRAVSKKLPRTLPAAGPILSDTIERALNHNPHPVAATILDALPAISFHHSGLADGRIRSEIAGSMATAELIGPNGMFHHGQVRVGLFAQSAHLDYVTRVHAAEETFIMLGGEGRWSCNGSHPERRTAGDVIHHPSMAPHSSVTDDLPLIAAWRWTGNIDYEAYTLTG